MLIKTNLKRIILGCTSLTEVSLHCQSGPGSQQSSPPLPGPPSSRVSVTPCCTCCIRASISSLPTAGWVDLSLACFFFNTSVFGSSSVYWLLCWAPSICVSRRLPCFFFFFWNTAENNHIQHVIFVIIIIILLLIVKTFRWSSIYVGWRIFLSSSLRFLVHCYLSEWRILYRSEWLCPKSLTITILSSVYNTDSGIVEVGV